MMQCFSVSGGGTNSQTDSDRRDAIRKKAIRVYLAISLIQVVTGLAVFGCSSIAVHYHSGGGFPYFIGSFAIGGMVSIFFFKYPFAHVVCLV